HCGHVVSGGASGYRHFLHDLVPGRNPTDLYVLIVDELADARSSGSAPGFLSFVRFAQLLQLGLRIVAVTVLPALCGLLPAPASHSCQCLAFAGSGTSSAPERWARASSALTAEDVAAHAAGHRQTVSHGRQLWFAVISPHGLGDVIGPFVGINDRCVSHLLACLPELVGSR